LRPGCRRVSGHGFRRTATGASSLAGNTSRHGGGMDTAVWLCATCGVEYEPAPRPPEHCPICEDERQYVPATGQRWTTIGELRRAGHTIDVSPVADDLWGLTAVPQVGIGQQAMLIKTPAGNVMFEVPGYIDEVAVETVRALGGINAIVASHPHMYGVQSAWSQAFNDAPIWVAGADAQWLGYRPAAVRVWSEPFDVVPGVRLDQVGGHFPGSTIALWADGADASECCSPAMPFSPSPTATPHFCAATRTKSRYRPRRSDEWPITSPATRLRFYTIISAPRSIETPAVSCSFRHDAISNGLAELTIISRRPPLIASAAAEPLAWINRVRRMPEVTGVWRVRPG